MTDDRRGALAIVGAASLWGTWRIWLPGPALDPAAQGAMVLTVAGLIGTAIALRQGVPRVPSRVWAGLAAFAVFEAANYLLYFAALSSGDSAVAGVTHYLAPVLVALAAPLAGERLGRRVSLATPIAFLATLGVVGFGGADGSVRAALLGAGSAVFYAANIFVSKRLGRQFSPWALVGFHDLAAAPIVWAFSSTPPWTASPPELGLAMAGAVLGGAFAAAVYFYGLARVPAPRAAVLSYVEPVSTAVVGSLLLAEPLGLPKVACMAVVLAAGAFVASDAERPQASENTELS